MSDSEGTRPPLADDLSFLEDLDRGLDLDTPLREEPVHVSQDAEAPPSPAAVDRVATSQPSIVRRRPLLDLFPAGSAGPAGEAAPARAASPPPREATAPAPTRASRRRGPLRVVQQAMPRPEGGALTYEIFYGLHEKPFSLTSDPKFRYHSAEHDRVTQDMLTAIGRRDQVVALTGDVGTGKTTVCREIIEQLDRRTFTSFVSDPFVTIEDLLKTILMDFGVISRADLAGSRLAGATWHQLTASLREFLLSLARLNAFAVVFIDEAHNLSAEMLEHVRVIADIQDDQRLIQVVLVAQPSLFEVLDRPDLRPLSQRITTRCSLDPLAEDEVPGYVVHRLAVAGGGQSRVEFDDAALTLIYQVSGGVPRLVNRLCDRALTLGFEDSASLIDEALVETAARDLEMIEPERRSARALRVGLAAIALLALLVVGAGAAALVFRDQVGKVLTDWQAIPPPPPGPRLRMAAPIVPVPVPPADPQPARRR